MRRKSRCQNLFLVVILALLIAACAPANTPASSSGVQVIETDNKQETISDMVHMDNCGGTADSEQTATRSFSTTIEGSVALKAGYEVIEGSVSAKYSEARNTSKTIKLVAPPGTNMEFNLRWTEQTWMGRVTADGESGNYVARMPISVEQVEAKNLGCPTPIASSNWAITFEYPFPAGFWSSGIHKYTIKAICHTLKDSDGNPVRSDRTNSFEVSQNATLFSSNVYLRTSGLKDASLESNEVGNINPLQTTTATWSLIEMTRTDAELAQNDCVVTIMWDGGSPKSLMPGLPYQH